LKLLLATRSEHKRRELERLLGAAGAGWEIDSLPEDVLMPLEDGETFAENALGKARAAARATGRSSIADDSGIAAAALRGAPGVRSARYAGEHATDRQNLEKLLREVGYHVRSGSCRVRETHVILLDRGLAPSAQIDVLVEELARRPLEDVYLSPAARHLLERAAPAPPAGSQTAPSQAAP